VPDPLPERMLFVEPLRRRLRVRFGGGWIADSENIVLLHDERLRSGASTLAVLFSQV
jgi:uncharacterized protein (DUF427 family)